MKTTNISMGEVEGNNILGKTRKVREDYQANKVIVW
jgi:hypothetical protein